MYRRISCPFRCLQKVRKVPRLSLDWEVSSGPWLPNKYHRARDQRKKKSSEMRKKKKKKKRKTEMGGGGGGGEVRKKKKSLQTTITSNIHPRKIKKKKKRYLWEILCIRAWRSYDSGNSHSFFFIIITFFPLSFSFSFSFIYIYIYLYYFITSMGPGRGCAWEGIHSISGTAPRYLTSCMKLISPMCCWYQRNWSRGRCGREAGDTTKCGILEPKWPIVILIGSEMCLL